ncbi:MAG TPA: short-chain dehydrogenase [Cytophagales bacterium]|nr:short-chain dehydrogenase [Cytophagales bacterium]HAA19719.1 short-chain dehydrogenase [Cytophagales bacterium]HAP61619.1 short-chain dehydrogenase [Cytophagales bacterium]
MNLSTRKVFITGASAGIGKSMVKVLAEKGVTQIAAMARNPERLKQLNEEFPKVEFLFIVGDVGNPNDVQDAVRRIQEKWGGLDVLINNAGVVSAGALEKISDEDIVQMIQINLTGLVLLTKHALSLLRQSEAAAIMNVSSGLGYIAQPYYSVYAATKAGVKQFTDAMRRELVHDPIHVISVFPTATDTPMMVNAKMNRKMDDPEMVARSSIEGMVSGLREVIFGGEQRLKDIQLNFSDPEAMDLKAEAGLEAMRQRTEHHRAM